MISIHSHFLFLEISLACTMQSTQIFRILGRGFREINYVSQCCKNPSHVLSTAPQLKRLHFNDSTNVPFFPMNTEMIEFTCNIKYLGVQIDSSLNWKEQINVAVGKISRGIGIPRYSKRYLSLQNIQKMCFSIIDLHSRYCLSVWECAGVVGF